VKSSKFEKYRHNSGLNSRMANGKYQVRMEYGLHCGWAIEGAIGSEFKIDASYLSQNVSICTQLQAAAKQFGLSYLISGTVYALCSRQMQDQMRMIDRVKLRDVNEG
jgi:class 3 adenylate cyclase